MFEKDRRWEEQRQWNVSHLKAVEESTKEFKRRLELIEMQVATFNSKLDLDKRLREIESKLTFINLEKIKEKGV